MEDLMLFLTMILIHYFILMMIIFGGELFYTQHKKKLRPVAGMAVSHPGDVNYIHGVTPVLSGTRWVIPAFYAVKSF
jgi:hypothetical protein